MTDMNSLLANSGAQSVQPASPGGSSTGSNSPTGSTGDPNTEDTAGGADQNEAFLATHAAGGDHGGGHGH